MKKEKTSNIQIAVQEILNKEEDEILLTKHNKVFAALISIEKYEKGIVLDKYEVEVLLLIVKNLNGIERGYVEDLMQYESIMKKLNEYKANDDARHNKHSS